MNTGPLRPRLEVSVGRLPGAPRGPRRRPLAQALAAAARMAGECGRVSVDVVWGGDRIVRALNRRHTGRGGATDVLAFADGARHPDAGGRRLGEIVCNLDRARRCARALGHRFEAEAVLYAAHGLLHLLGADDRTPSGRRSMRRLERGALAAAGLVVGGGEWDES